MINFLKSMLVTLFATGVCKTLIETPSGTISRCRNGAILVRKSIFENISISFTRGYTSTFTFRYSIKRIPIVFRIRCKFYFGQSGLEHFKEHLRKLYSKNNSPFWAPLARSDNDNKFEVGFLGGKFDANNNLKSIICEIFI